MRGPQPRLRHGLSVPRNTSRYTPTVHAVAAAHGLEISGHCAPSLHLHVAAAVPNLRHVELFHDHVRVDHQLFDGVVDPVDGCLAPDLTRPGLGLSLRSA